MSGRSIRTAVAGVGNCASALIQGTEYYADGTTKGLTHEQIGDYRVQDIKPVCAFDVDKRKVGCDLSEAIFADPNCTEKFAEVPNLSAPVYRGPKLDGVASHTQDFEAERRVEIDESSEQTDIADKLNEHGVDVLVNYLPVGSETAVYNYAEACLDSDVAFVNAVPVFVASDPSWGERFERAGIPVVGDDIKSQLGATITHRNIVQLLQNRGVNLEQTYQLNVGGNTDFLNMLDRTRLSDKKTSKTEAVNKLLEDPLDPTDIHIGPSDYIPWLDDQKTAFIRVEGTKFGGIDVEIDIKLDVEDSPNSAGSVVDAIRCAQLARDRGVAGPLKGPSAVTMKHPPEQMTDEAAVEAFNAFITSDRK